MPGVKLEVKVSYNFLTKSVCKPNPHSDLICSDGWFVVRRQAVRISCTPARGLNTTQWITQTCERI